MLKRLLEMDGIERTRAAVEKVAKILKKHPATIYRWIESYNCSGRLSALLRRNRADRGKSRLSSKVDTIIEDAIKKIYLTARRRSRELIHLRSDKTEPMSGGIGSRSFFFWRVSRHGIWRQLGMFIGRGERGAIGAN